MVPSISTTVVVGNFPLATSPFERLPIEIQEQIFSRLSQRDLRRCVSLVNSHWHFVSRRHLRRIARWKTINARSPNNSHITDHTIAQELLLYRIQTGLVTTLTCNFFFDSTLETQPLWDFADPSDVAWKQFAEALTRSLDPNSWPSSLFTLFVKPVVKDDLSGDHQSHHLPLAVQPCLLHQLREVLLRGYLDFKLHLKPLLAGMSYLQVLMIAQFKTVGDWTLDLDLFEVLASCPHLKRLGVSGPLARFIRLTGELNGDRFPSEAGSLGGVKKKALHGLIELSLGRVEVRMDTLKELVSLCSNMQVFRVQDIRPAVPRGNGGSVATAAATETVQKELDQLIEEAQWLCPNLRWMAVMTREDIWSDHQTLEALERYLGPQGATNPTRTIGRVASKIHQLTLNCKSVLPGQNEHLNHPRIFGNLTFLHLASTTANKPRRMIDHRILSHCIKLEHFSMDPGLYLYVGDVMDLAQFDYPPGALPAPAGTFVPSVTGDLTHQHRRFLTSFLRSAQWTLQELNASPPWVRNRILASQPNLLEAGISAIVGVPPQQLTQLSQELALLTLAPRTLWACHGLRTLEVQLDPGFYELGVFGAFLAETCPQLELIHIRYATLRMGQIEEHQRYERGHLTGRFLNELLPMCGLKRLRTFEITVEILLGYLYAEDFRFMASTGVGCYDEGDECEGGKDNMNVFQVDGGFEGVGRTQRSDKVSTVKQDVFWPKLEVFMLEVATARKEIYHRYPVQFQGSAAQQSKQRTASDGFGSIGMLKKLAKMRPDVEFKFLRSYWDGGMVV
ncbi:hypothetical protein BGZ93_008329 [Podila epicladia]|nr:hypothetical protein BGZ92_004348 [Podila epicladia]KAG0092434.1 hypothetical protein BGZ93_008329 [Podila epicladia]